MLTGTLLTMPRLPRISIRHLLSKVLSFQLLIKKMKPQNSTTMEGMSNRINHKDLYKNIMMICRVVKPDFQLRHQFLTLKASGSIITWTAWESTPGLMEGATWESIRTIKSTAMVSTSGLMAVCISVNG